MAIASKLKNYLLSQGVDYKVSFHSHTGSSMETAQTAHIPGKQLAKAVVVKDEQGYLMVVIPSAYHVDLGALHRELQRPLGLATEAELKELFPDCETGAIPALGPAYGMETVWDRTLSAEPEIYFEGGDHEMVIQVSGEQFRRLMRAARPGQFSRHL
jgi:Ala-tRNA(Pro) deacylase